MAAPRLLVGQTLSHYRILERIGGGGMGVVFKAEDTRLHRFVALKFLPDELAKDAHALARFEREAQAASGLNNPHICTVHDIGEEGGRAFICMELLEGHTLKDTIQQGSLSVNEIVELALEIADGLAAAHSKGIIHRDLKPANIFVTQNGQPKILDFGLAKVSPKRVLEDPEVTELTADSAEEALTTPGIAVGTVAYMSPEQVRGERVDARSDLFSFGVVLYEMATGRMAFSGNTCGVIFEAILNRAPAAPTVVRPDLPKRLEEIVQKALEKEPSVRYQHATEMRADLKRLQRDLQSGQHGGTEQELAGAAVLTGGVDAGGGGLAGGSSALRWLGRRRYVVALGCSVLVLPLLAAMIWPDASRARWERVFGPRLPEQKNLVVLPFTAVDQQESEQAYCNGFTETVTAKLAQINALQVPSALDVRTQKVTTTPAARTHFGANLVLVPSWQHFQNMVRINLALVDAKTGRQLRTETITEPMSDLLHLQDQVVTKASRMLQLQLSGPDASLLTANGTVVPAAYDFYIQARGYLQDYVVPEKVESAILLFRKALESDSSYADATAGLGEAYWRKFELTHDNKWAIQATASCQKAVQLGNDHAPSHTCLARVFNSRGDFEEAANQYRRALEIEPNNDDAYGGLAAAYESLGRADEAEKLYKRAISARPGYWATYNWLGLFYMKHARYSEAGELFSQVVSLAPDSFTGYYNLAAVRILEGKYGDAIPFLEHSLSIRPSADALSNLGTAYFQMHRYSESATRFEEAIKLNDHDYLMWGNLGDAYYWLPGRRAEAASAYARAIILAEQRLHINPRDAQLLGCLAEYHAMRDERKSAVDYAAASLRLQPNSPDLLFNAGVVYAQIGDDDRALNALELAVSLGIAPEMLRDTPTLDVLNKSPRFLRLLGRSQN